MVETARQILEDIVVVQKRRYDRHLEFRQKDEDSDEECDKALLDLLQARLELARYIEAERSGG